MRTILFSCLCFILLTGVVFAQNAKEEASCDLKSFLDDVAKKMQKTIIYDTTVLGRKLFLSNVPWDKPQELHRLFLSVLEYSGYFLEIVGPKGEIWKIKRNIQGPWTQTPILDSLEALNQIQNEDQFVTMLIPVKNVSVKEIQTGLRALRFVNPQGGNLLALEGSDTILVTDFAPNVKRVYEVIQYLDTKPEKEELSIKLDGQSVVLPIEEDKQILLMVYECKNISLTITKKDGTVISHIDEGKQGIKLGMNHYIQEGATFHFTVQALNTGISQCNIRIEARSEKHSTDLWGFSLSRFLKERKTIRFSLNFQSTKKQAKAE